AEAGDRLDQTAFELITFDVPLHPLQTGLESYSVGRRGQQTTQHERTQAHGENSAENAFPLGIGAALQNLSDRPPSRDLPLRHIARRRRSATCRSQAFPVAFAHVSPAWKPRMS